MITWKWGGSLNTFKILQIEQIDTGIDYKETKTVFTTVEGYIDRLTGSDDNKIQDAIVEESTHILITDKFVDGITDNMEVAFKDRLYFIEYVDNVMELNHHLEIYLKYGGGYSGV